MEPFAKIVHGWNPLTIFTKISIFDVLQGLEHATAIPTEGLNSKNTCKFNNKSATIEFDETLQ